MTASNDSDYDGNGSGLKWFKLIIGEKIEETKWIVYISGLRFEYIMAHDIHKIDDKY